MPVGTQALDGLRDQIALDNLSRTVTHPDFAPLVDPLFAAHKEGKNIFFNLMKSSLLFNGIRFLIHPHARNSYRFPVWRQYAFHLCNTCRRDVQAAKTH